MACGKTIGQGMSCDDVYECEECRNKSEISKMMEDLMYLSVTIKMDGGNSEKLDEIIEKYKHHLNSPK